MSTLRNVYYRTKPFLPTWLRMKVRRLYAQKLRKCHTDVWPIDESAGQTPEGWAGWPDNKRFAFVLTHDVEGQYGLEKVRQLAQVEMARGVKAAYNFIPEGEYRVSEDLLEWLRAQGFEIGVHDLNHDGFLCSSRKSFQSKAQKINHYLKEWEATGFRAGFMMRNLEWFHDLDISYDCSTFDTDPFEPQPEGAGTIFPYEVNGHQGQRYVELPYTLPQDSSLFLILEEKNPAIWYEKLDWIAEKGGMALVNIHPDYVRFEGGPKQGFTYDVQHVHDLLSRLEEKYSGHYWNPLPGELVHWFENRGIGEVSHARSASR